MFKSIQSYLRFAAASGRLVVQVGPFLTTITESWDNPYINYAIPDEDCVPTGAHIRSLVEHYRAHARVPRLEFIPEVAPNVQAVLHEHGFVDENTHPLMVATPLVGDVRCPEGFEFRIMKSREDVAAMIAAQHEAYGEPVPRDEDVERIVRSLNRGNFAMSVVERASGTCAGGGVCTTPRDGVSEVAGIGIRERYRRRGLGEALTRELLRQCGSRGVHHPFLMAAGTAEARMYQRAGFREVGRVLCMRMG